MELLLQKFIQKYTGLTGQGNTDQNKGQCVGLVSLWMDQLGVPHEYGNAKDLLTNADTSLFQVIQNSPDNFPVPGDILVWDQSWGGGFGHTAVAVTADANTFTSFEQNDITPQDTNGACEVLSHPNYEGVLGWLHFTGRISATPELPTDLNTHGLDLTNSASLQVALDTWFAVSQGQYVGVAQYNSEKQMVEDLQKEILDLQSKHGEDQKEIVNLNSSLSTLSTSNKDYATQALEAEKVADTYTKYMDEIANELKITDTSLSDQELHNEIIKEIITLQENQKTAVGSQTPQEASDIWQTSLKNIVDWLLTNGGFAKFLEENNLHVVDSEGNLLDGQTVADRVIAYLDDRFHRLDFLEQAIQKTKTQVVKGANFLQKFLHLFYTTA